MSPTSTVNSPAPSVAPKGHRSTQSMSHVGNDYAVRKHRRTASTGGGRAWTEDEESYLLRTRMHKMPYKHIAAHLQKTELACRLHYHQMSYGNNRRRRNSSVSTTASSVFSQMGRREGSPEYGSFTQLSPVASPPSSPELSHEKPDSYTSDSQSHQRPHIPILPRPILSHQEQQPSHLEKLNQSLTIDTSFVSQHHHHHHAPRMQIDPARLQHIYESHRASFWTAIASDYSPNGPFSSVQLEEAFFNFCVRRGTPPVTPDSSPRSNASAIRTTESTLNMSQPRGFSAINGPAPIQLPALKHVRSASMSPGERCSVSSLLNEVPETASI